MRKLRILPQDRTILNGNTHIGYIDEFDDVYVFENGYAKKIGSSDSFAEALGLVTAWMDGKLT